MKRFLDENFLLNNPSAERLYHDYAAEMPIIDYHCHLNAKDIAENRTFKNISQAWLEGDHYKWRAMRTNGISEDYITGRRTDKEKFDKWAETVPATIRNPLYHWTHLELKRYFDIDSILSPNTADSIYKETEKLLNTEAFSTCSILKNMNVKLVCTTDDPVDSLVYHQKIREKQQDFSVRPTFRPDKAVLLNDMKAYNEYIALLEDASGVKINGFSSLMAAVEQRHNYFHEAGCRISDHGIESLNSVDFTEKELDNIISSARNGIKTSLMDQQKLQTAFLLECGRMNYRRGWVMQLHYGAIRNNNKAIFSSFGPDAGCDSIHDLPAAAGLSNILGRLSGENHLPKTILYNLNPADNAMVATMAGNFQGDQIPGKIQYGAAWWFLDQKFGMTEHLNTLSSLGLLSRFIGMLTDSRSFLSFPRHEYFRRILCQLLGEDVENGEIPADWDLLGGMVKDICFYNCRHYLNLEGVL